MRLIVRTSLLSKAGKRGLIAVQKQVTKKGKTFTQTFYVKPSTTPKKPNGPSVVTALETRPQKILLMRGDETYELESNRPEGGFYVNSRRGEKAVAVRVPEKYIIKTFEHRGYTFVVHRRLKSVEDQTWRADFSVTETTSGLRASSGDTPEEAEALTRTVMAEGKMSQKRLDEVIRDSRKVEDIDDVIMATDDWSAEEPVVYLTDDELRTFAVELRNNILEGEESGVTVDQIKKWLKEVQEVDTDKDVSFARHDVVDSRILEQAVTENLQYSEAEERESAILEIIGLIGESELYGYTSKNVDYETIADWARTHAGNLTEGIALHYYGASSDYGGEWSAADVVAYAIEYDMNLDDAQAAAEESLAEQEEETKAEALEKVNFTDSHGKEWEGGALQDIGNWVGGMVRNTREAAKELDDCRRQKSEADCSTWNDIVNVIEKHAVIYTEGTLYRGTGNGNHAWLEAETGDIIPYGIASFSKSEGRALGFDSKVLLVIEKTEDVDNPVMGVDVQQLMRDGNDEGFGAAISEAGVDSYASEQEVIIRAPALVVIRREANVVYVKPTEMDLLQMMKARFENRVKMMERTFNYRLHGEPEDAWK